MLALFAGMAILQPPRGFEGWSAGAAMLALWGATPFYWLVACRRGCIEFDANGARWRAAFGAWKSARWDEIESCDARMTSTGGKITHWKFVVRTRNGEFSWTNSFENADQLAPFGARFCPMFEAKPEDWPRLFSYRSGESLFFWIASLFLSGFVVAILLMVLGARHASEIAWQTEILAAFYGWPFALAGLALLAAFALGIPAIILLLYLCMALNSWRHRDETIAATSSGLSWSVGGRERLFAAYDELQILRVEARGRWISLPFYRLQSARGEFIWNHSLCGASQLSRTLFERAPQLEHQMQARLREELSQTRDESGDVISFDFKTRTLRAMLWGGLCFSLLTWGITIFGPLEPANGNAPAPTWLNFIIASIVTVMTLYGAQLFRRGCLRLDARGIEWDLPLRKRFVAWDEIEELRWEKGLPLIVGGRKIPLCGPSIAPAHAEQLLEIVAQRAFNAGREWERADKINRR